MLTTLSIFLITFIILTPFWDFTLKLGNYLSLIPFVLYTIAIMLYKKFSVGKKKEKETDSIEITNGDIFKAFFINFLAFAIFLLIFSLIIKLTKNYLSINVFLFIYYVLFTQNAIVTSPGFIAGKIYVERNTFKTSLFLLINNLYKYSLFYFALFLQNFRESEVGTVIVGIILIFYLMNVFYRFCISKKYSLVETILKISYKKRIECDKQV